MSENNILVASGLIDNIDLSADYTDVEFKVVESIIDAMEEMNNNPTKYQYILISCQSFLTTKGANDEDIMETLASVLSRVSYSKFVFIEDRKSVV